MMVTVVRRGSQVHQVFQMGRAQIIPLRMQIIVKSSPTSTLAAVRVSHFMSLRERYSRPNTAAAKKASIPTHAALM